MMENYFTQSCNIYIVSKDHQESRDRDLEKEQSMNGAMRRMLPVNR